MAHSRIVNELEHPLPFVFFMTLSVLGTMAVGAYLFGRLGMPGPAGFFKGH